MVKLVAGLKDLRPAPGLSGQIKAIQLGTEKCFLNDTWSYLTFDPTSESFLPFCSTPFGHMANGDFPSQPGSFITVASAKERTRR